MNTNQPDLIRTFSIISRYSRRYIHHQLQTKGHPHLGHSQARFMMLLHHGYDGKHQDDFTHALKKDKTTVARAMAKLEQADLITREKDPKDKRANLIKATPKAHHIFTTIDTIMEDLNCLLTENLNAKEQEQLLLLLKKIEHNLTKNDDKNPKGTCPHD